jgi:hypothetical protein
MSAGTAKKEVANPCCTTDTDLPPAPSIGEFRDPAEPHPDEPGAPPDAPDRVRVAKESAEADSP